MSLHHYGPLPYELAAEQASAEARRKLHETIDAGKGLAMQSVEDITREFKMREDYLVPSRTLGYHIQENGAIQPTWPDSAGPYELTDQARAQLLSRLGIPQVYADTLAKPGKEGQGPDPWALELLGYNLQELTANRLAEQPTLFRVVEGRIKGVLSSSYRRMDAAPVIEGFIKRGLEIGLVPIAGRNTDTRFHIKMLMPRLFEPAPHEVVAFGFSFCTSDYGASALELSMFLMRLWCTNFAVGESAIRKVHLGRRFENPADAVLLSQRTHDLDTETVASAVQDVVTGDRLATWTGETCELIRSATEKQLDVPKVLQGMRKSWGLTKEQAERAKMLYTTLREPALLPPQEGAWRLSNVLSLMAQSEKGDGAMNLEEAAMAVLK